MWAWCVECFKRKNRSLDFRRFIQPHVRKFRCYYVTMMLKISSYIFEIKSYESLFFCLVSVYILLDTKTKCALAYTTYLWEHFFYVAFIWCWLDEAEVKNEFLKLHILKEKKNIFEISFNEWASNNINL